MRRWTPPGTQRARAAAALRLLTAVGVCALAFWAVSAGAPGPRSAYADEAVTGIACPLNGATGGPVLPPGASQICTDCPQDLICVACENPTTGPSGPTGVTGPIGV